MVALFEKHLRKQFILISLAFATALEASFLLKMIFMTPRPYETWATSPLEISTVFSFPSMHATFIFAALPFFQKGNLRPYRFLWIIFATLVAFSRVYIGVHYVSDVLAGAGLGYAIGQGLFYLEDRFSFAEWVSKHFVDRFEVRRQWIHALSGLTLAFLVYIDLLNVNLMLLGCGIGAVLCLVQRFISLPFVTPILNYFERPHHMKAFPGRGLFFMVVGSFLAVYFFEKNIAVAAIVILALGDSITNIFGRYFGEVKLPYNRKKTIDGVLVGVAAATLGSFFFVPFHVALIASLGAMFVETLDLKIFIEIDDNLLIPVVAGGIMTMMM
jgi:dolichol kinase